MFTWSTATRSVPRASAGRAHSPSAVLQMRFHSPSPVPSPEAAATVPFPWHLSSPSAPLPSPHLLPAGSWGGPGAPRAGRPWPSGEPHFTGSRWLQRLYS